MNAKDLADKIQEAKAKADERAYNQLRSKCFQELAVMAVRQQSEVLIDLDESDLRALNRVTEELRTLGYRFKFVEQQDETGDFQANKLLVSIKHCFADDSL